MNNYRNNRDGGYDREEGYSHTTSDYTEDEFELEGISPIRSTSTSTSAFASFTYTCTWCNDTMQPFHDKICHIVTLVYRFQEQVPQISNFFFKKCCVLDSFKEDCLLLSKQKLFKRILLDITSMNSEYVMSINEIEQQTTIYNVKYSYDIFIDE